MHPRACDAPDSSVRGSTIFDRALQEYMEQLPKDKKHLKQLKFIELCRGAGDVTPKAIQDLIRQEESKHHISGPAKRLFGRVILALEQYNDVIGQLGWYCACYAL